MVEVMLVEAGLVPTMVYLTVLPRRSLKLPFHWVRPVAGALGASSIWFGPALNIGLASRMSGYLVSWAKAILAHASTRDAAITLTAKRLFILVLLLKNLKKPCYRQRNGETCGALRNNQILNILVEWQQQVKRIAEIVCLILQRDHDSIATAKRCNFRQTPLRLRHGHDRSIAINGVPGCGEVPSPSLFVRRLLLAGGGGELNWWCQPRDGKRPD